jgi:maleate isomerase
MTDFAYTLDIPGDPCLGLIVLQTDETIEQDFRRLLPASARLYVSRVPSGLEVTRETLGAMEAHIPAAAGLLPEPISFDAIGYGCTSGTSVIGTARVGELVRQGARTEAVTEPVSALLAASAALGVRRLAFLSPYVEAVSAGLCDVLRDNGLEIPVFGSFNTAEEAKVARIAGPSIVAAASQLAGTAEVDAIFLSCTNLRTLDVIAEIERIIGKPVLSSNQVLAWHMCRLSGAGKMPEGFGRLLSAE